MSGARRRGILARNAAVCGAMSITLLCDASARGDVAAVATIVAAGAATVGLMMVGIVAAGQESESPDEG